MVIGIYAISSDIQRTVDILQSVGPRSFWRVQTQGLCCSTVERLDQSRISRLLQPDHVLRHFGSEIERSRIVRISQTLDEIFFWIGQLGTGPDWSTVGHRPANLLHLVRHSGRVSRSALHQPAPATTLRARRRIRHVFGQWSFHSLANNFYLRETELNILVLFLLTAMLPSTLLIHCRSNWRPIESRAGARQRIFERQISLLNRPCTIWLQVWVKSGLKFRELCICWLFTVVFFFKGTLYFWHFDGPRWCFVNDFKYFWMFHSTASSNISSYWWTVLNIFIYLTYIYKYIYVYLSYSVTVDLWHELHFLILDWIIHYPGIYWINF